MKIESIYKFFRNLLIFLLIAIIIVPVAGLIPIKYCLTEIPKSDGKEFYIVRYDGVKNWWILTGDANGLYDWNTVSDQPVTIVGENFENVVSVDLYLEDVPTYFVVWGEAEVKETYDENYNVVFREYVIHCRDWDVLENVHSRNEFRMNFSKNYLTIYDYKWFDAFRSFFGLLEE